MFGAWPYVTIDAGPDGLQPRAARIQQLVRAGHVGDGDVEHRPRALPPMPLTKVTMVGAISTIVLQSRRAAGSACALIPTRGWRQPLGRASISVPSVGDDEADGVAGALVVLGPHRHRDARRGQRLVRQAVAFHPESAAASRRRWPAPRRSAVAGGIGHRCAARPSETAAWQKRRFAHAPVPAPTAARRSKGRVVPAPRSPTLAGTHLAEGGQQLRRDASAAQHGARSGGVIIVGHGRRRGVALGLRGVPAGAEPRETAAPGSPARDRWPSPAATCARAADATKSISRWDCIF